MLHRKKYHKDATSKCNKFLNGVCTLDEFKCWYLHSGRRGGGAGTESSEETNSSECENEEQGFQRAQRKPVPPNTRI